MRDGWQTKTIGDVCELVNGGTPKTDVAEFWGGEHLWITPAEMGKRQSSYAATTARTLTDLGMQNSSATPLPPMSVILSSRAPIGHLVINTEPMAFNQGCKGLIPGRSLDHKFLFYYLGSIVQLLNDLGTGTTFKELSGGKLKEVPIPVPPLAEQKRIVAILDEAFAGIAAATANAEKNLANARELFESCLDASFNFDLEEAEQRTLESLCDPKRIITYGVIKLGDDIPNGIPCLRTSNVRWLSIDLKGLKSISRTLSDSYRRTILEGGEVLVNVRGTLGGVAVAEPEVVGWNVSREVAVVPTNTTKANSYYLAYWIGRRESQAWLTGVQKGVAYTGINIADLRELPVLLPNMDKQIEIVRRLDLIRDESRRLEQLYQKKLSDLSQLKHAILQKAFSGELTALPGAEMQEEAA